MIALSSPTKSQQLLELLEAEIASGRFAPDEAIPSQTEMAKNYGVSVATVREALSVLSQQGLIERVQGKGAFLTHKAIHGEATVKTGVFALMFEPMPADTPVSLPFYDAAFAGMEGAARKLGVEVCFVPAHTDTLPRLVGERKVDGVILLGAGAGAIERVKSVGLPVIAFGDFSDQTHCIMADDREGARRATRYLLDLGHRRIGFVSVEDTTGGPGPARLEGFLSTMQEAGLSVPEEWIERELTLPNTTPRLPCIGCNECASCMGWEVLKSRLHISRADGALPFTALICHNDPVAMGIIEHARADGFEVPRDFSVVGFDNISGSYHFSPQITSIDISLGRMGQEALRLLHKLADRDEATMSSDGQVVYERPTVPVELAVHESTRPPSGF